MWLANLLPKMRLIFEDMSLLWAIRFWAIDKFGYVNTKIIDNDGVKKEVVEFFAPMIGGK